MKLHVISTINGLHNEGMRNIATHLSNEIEREHTVTYSPLKDVIATIINGRKADCVLVFARLIKPVYYMLRLIRPFVKNICVVCVQPVSEQFVTLNKKHRVVDYCLTICESDVNYAFDADRIYTFPVGINELKFQKRNINRADLCKKLDLPDDKKIVLHVGHCSSGRGLEDIITLDKEDFYSVVIASGMFDDESTIKTLTDAGVDVRFGYVENIEDYYNCADVYVFPTKSSEFVISVPLSVMEALSCGTPVVAYKSFEKLSLIETNSENAITLVDSQNDLVQAVSKAANFSSDTSYLKNPVSWQQVSCLVMGFLKGKLE